MQSPLTYAPLKVKIHLFVQVCKIHRVVRLQPDETFERKFPAKLELKCQIYM